MPKQAQKIDRFEGGMVTYHDKRDLPENSLANATDVMVDVVGKVRQMGRDRDHWITGITGSINPGYGLYAFNSDYNIAGDSEEYKMLAIQNGKTINIYDNNGEHPIGIDSDLINFTRNGALTNEDGSDVRPSFYFVDGALRVADGNLSHASHYPK